MPNYDFNKVAKQFIKITLRHGCSPVNLLHIFQLSSKTVAEFESKFNHDFTMLFAQCYLYLILC